MGRNTILIIIASIFVGMIGFSFGYFTINATKMGEGSTATVTTADLSNATLIPTKLDGLNNPIYPGTMNWIGVSVKASKTNPSASGTYTVKYEYEFYVTFNDKFETALNYKLYKTTSPIETPVICQEASYTGIESHQYTRTCTLNDTLSELGPIDRGTIAGGAEGVIGTDTVVADGTTTNYYYLIIEYPNENKNQNNDIGKTVNISFADVKAIELTKS